MEGGSSTHGEADVECDRNSLSSLATTASLSSRIASLAIFGEEKPSRAYDCSIETLGEGDEEEELVEVAEGDLLRELDQLEPALQARLPPLWAAFWGVTRGARRVRTHCPVTCTVSQALESWAIASTHAVRAPTPSC
jgi:hypothetical protein